MTTPTTTPTTVQFAVPKQKTDQSFSDWMLTPEWIADNTFHNENHRSTIVKTARCHTLDMSKAHVALTPPHITDRVRDYANDSDVEVRTYTIKSMWAVFAPRERDGVLFVASGMNSMAQHGYGTFFETEAEATKHAKKLAKVAANYHKKEAQRAHYAQRAAEVCQFDPSTVATASEINPNDAIGEVVRIHQMNKYRVGIIVDQTPTKYVVVYTTPSNPNHVRTSNISKTSEK